MPSYGTASVSQFSIVLLLELCHHIGHHSDSVHAGQWADCADWCYWDYPLIELAGKTISIVGVGQIGQPDGKIAESLGMRVIAYDLHPTNSGREIAEYVNLDTLYHRADVITLHCNLTPENTHIINRDSIARMKDGVILIDNARGQLIDEQDVVEALNSGKMAGVGLDMVYTEPIRSARRYSAWNPSINCAATVQSAVLPEVTKNRTGIPCASTARCILVLSPLLYGPLPDFHLERQWHQDVL